MEECSRQLKSLSDDSEDPDTVDELVVTFTTGNEPFPGIGHPFHYPVDPRAEKLLEIADDENVAGEHVYHLYEVRDGFEEQSNKKIPINVTGAIAALTADMGLSPVASKGLAIISRTAGLVAEIDDEAADPIAMDVLKLLDNHTTYTQDQN
jgi:citrate synthase